MASIRVNGRGKLFFDFYYRNVRCREYTLLDPTVANRRAMEKVGKQIDKEIAAGTFSYRAYFPASSRADLFEPRALAVAPPESTALVEAAVEAGREMRKTGRPQTVALPGSPLFREFADKWFDEREIDWKRSTRVKVTDILNGHLIPRFRGRRVGDITKEDILDFRAHLAKDHREGPGLSPARVNGILNVLRQIFDEAADRFDFTTPYRGIRPLRVPRTRVEPLSLDEVRRFLAAVPSAFRPYYTVAFFTGLRTSELHGLRWEAVDFERAQILVRTTLVYGELDEPKTSGSEREVEMRSIVLEALRQQKVLTAPLDSPFVFCASNGQPMNYRNLARRVWHPTLKAIGLRPRRPYQTRHTAATLWLAAGEAPEWIARQMGHSTTKMLFTVYSRFVPNLTRKDGSAMEQLIGSVLGDPSAVLGASEADLAEECHD